MVEEGRRSMDVNGAESTSVASHTGLKLKINLRDRQHLRKRRRSLSPGGGSSDSSFQDQERLSVLATSPTVKKSYREHRHRNGSTDGGHSASARGSDSKQNGAAEILLVDMNGTSPDYDVENESSSSSLSQDKVAVKSELGKSRASVGELRIEAAAGIIQRLSREELEKLFLEQMCFALRERGSTGALEKQLEASEAQLDRFRRKTEQLHKQVNDLTAVIRRYVGQATRRKDGATVAPVKITRAVGLQVNTYQPPSGSNSTPSSSTNQHSTAATSLSGTASPLKKPHIVTAPSRQQVKMPVTSVATSQALPQTVAAHIPVNTSPNMMGSRIPLPPSFSMPSPEIASYVPQQAMPRYRSASAKKANETQDHLPDQPVDNSLKLRLQTKVGNVLQLAAISKLANAPPLKQMVAVQSTQQQRILIATPVTSSGSLPIATPGSIGSSDPSVTRVRISNGMVQKNAPNPSATAAVKTQSPAPAAASLPSAARTPPVTTVNKVTLPVMPRVIDLTDDEQEKEASGSSPGRTNGSATKPAPVAPVATPAASGGSGFSVTVKAAGSPVIAPKPSTSSSSATPGASGSPAGTRPPVKPVVAVPSSNGMPRSTAVAQTSSNVHPSSHRAHPAALPATPVGPFNPAWKAVPPRPTLKISRVANGIVLSWTMQATASHADIASYQLYAYQEGNMPPSAALWKKVGDVKALPLPMACTLTQFLEGHRYHFAVRAMDVHGRVGHYSEPNSIVLS